MTPIGPPGSATEHVWPCRYQMFGSYFEHVFYMRYFRYTSKEKPCVFYRLQPSLVTLDTVKSVTSPR